MKWHVMIGDDWEVSRWNLIKKHNNYGGVHKMIFYIYFKVTPLCCTRKAINIYELNFLLSGMMHSSMSLIYSRCLLKNIVCITLFLWHVLCMYFILVSVPHVQSWNYGIFSQFISHILPQSWYHLLAIWNLFIIKPEDLGLEAIPTGVLWWI